MKCEMLSYDFDVEGHTVPKCNAEGECPLDKEHVTGTCFKMMKEQHP